MATLSIGAAILVARQCRKPAGWLGQLNVSLMNLRHSRVTDWGLGNVRFEKGFTILDVGCGGGRTIEKLAAIAGEGKVYGIDYSAASVAVARRKNAKQIEAGRVDIREGSVASLPFPDRTFDVVTAVETHYYWPDLVANLREILRVLKPGGRLAVIAETYRGRRLDALYLPAMKLLGATYLTVQEHGDALRAAGFAEAEVAEERAKGWICAVGRKSSAEGA
ncbi:MAG TPA: class I SAM-dependent methyltransferase [Thermoanaerobaculia bacterium]|nr:class I SAM-dependent methyltransferase [Thermoanaerobaculia bacterium]